VTGNRPWSPIMLFCYSLPEFHINPTNLKENGTAQFLPLFQKEKGARGGSPARHQLS